MIGPRDFFDTLAELDWAGRFESFDPSERQILRRYHELAQDLGQRPFFAKLQRLAFKASPEESYERLEHAGDDALRSMTMTFRQLWMVREPARFETVRGVLRKRAAPQRGDVDVTRLLDELGRRYSRARKDEMMRHVWIDDPMGEPKEIFVAEQVIDDWLYGGTFHSDDGRAKRVRSWSKTQYEWSLIKSINALAAVMWELDIVVGGVVSAYDELAA